MTDQQIRRSKIVRCLIGLLLKSNLGPETWPVLRRLLMNAFNDGLISEEELEIFFRNYPALEAA